MSNRKKDVSQGPFIQDSYTENGGPSGRPSRNDSHPVPMQTEYSKQHDHNYPPNPSPTGYPKQHDHNYPPNPSPTGYPKQHDHNYPPNTSPTGYPKQHDHNYPPNPSPTGYPTYKGASSCRESELKCDTFPIEKMNKEPECHMKLEELLPSPEHTVLVNITLLGDGKIVPYSSRPVWDYGHVKLPPGLPQSSHNVRWNATKKALQHLMNCQATARDVEMAIKSYNLGHSKEWNFHTLWNYTKVAPKFERDTFSFVIGKMATLALKLPELIQSPIPLLRCGRSHAITMSQEQIACLLANAFFCTFPHRNTSKPGSEYGNFPTINFSSLFADPCPRKLEKLRALFHYFDVVTDDGTKPKGLVTFERIHIAESDLPNWPKSTSRLTNLHVSEKGLIEKEGRGMLQVDFASKFVGGGVLGRGLVQEEIRFLQCPELIVSRLFTEKLEDNECLKITGVQKYSDTEGYSDSFVWTGAHKDETDRDKWKRRFCQIVAIDAMNFNYGGDQYSPRLIKRELNKAFVGFRKDPKTPEGYVPAIATGNWGCGAFKGDHRLKALIQMMAAAEAKRDLAYFTFGDRHQAQELQRMHDLIKDKVNVGKLYALLSDYCSYYKSHRSDPNLKDVFEFLKKRLPSSQL